MRVSFAHVAKVCIDSMCAIICIRERMRNSAKTEKGVVLYATHTCHSIYIFIGFACERFLRRVAGGRVLNEFSGQHV